MELVGTLGGSILGCSQSGTELCNEGNLVLPDWDRCLGLENLVH